MSEPDRPCPDCGSQVQVTPPARFDCPACGWALEYQVNEFTTVDGARIVVAGDGVVTTDDLMELELRAAAFADEVRREQEQEGDGEPPL